MAPNMNFISAFLCLVATLFFVIGCIGYSDDEDTVKHTAWITVKSGGNTVYYALRDVYISSGGGGSYSDCANFSDACEKCEDDGKSAFGLLFIAAIFAAITAITCGLLGQSAGQLATCYSTNATMSLISVVLALLACGASLIAVAMFMGDCYDEIDDTTNDDLKWGPGSILSLIGLLIMGFVSILQFLSTCIWK